MQSVLRELTDGTLTIADLPHVQVMGVSFTNLSEAEAVDHIVSSLESGRGGYVVTPNVDILRKVARDTALAQAVEKAELVIADGLPTVWASRWQGTPLLGRVAFSEMIYPLARAASARGLPFVLLGGEEGVAEDAAEELLRYAPGLKIAATYAPPFGFEHDRHELSVLTEILEQFQPAIVVCAFGCPKQELLMAEVSPRFPSTWFIGAGGTLTILSGQTPSAPRWMRRAGLEWAHRLRLEPRRLFRRYVIDDIPFAIRMFAISAVKRVMASWLTVNSQSAGVAISSGDGSTDRTVAA